MGHQVNFLARAVSNCKIYKKNYREGRMRDITLIIIFFKEICITGSQKAFMTSITFIKVRI